MKINGLTLQERKRWTANGWQSYFVGADYTGTTCVFGDTKEEATEEMKRWKQGK